VDIRHYQQLGDDLIFELARKKKPLKIPMRGIPNVYILHALLNDKISG